MSTAKKKGSKYVAIMAGGIGSRFWPISRTKFPKQFLDILGTGRTLIQQTFDRYSKVVDPENIFVITSEEYIPIVKEQLPAIPHENIIGEPFRKNTAPCIAYISFKLSQKDPEACMVVAPSDNLVMDNVEFVKMVDKGFDFVCHINSLVTLGMKPTYPNTGYGYIQHDSLEAASGVYKVKTFTEKPNLELAKTFIESGDFLWNAGIFIWKVKNVLNAFEKYLPEMYEAFAADKDKFNTPKEKAAIEQIYPQCTSISIDFGIMEKADNVYVIPASFGWSDLGTWNSAWDSMEKDEQGNAVAGKHVLLMDTNRSVVHVPDKKMVVLQGLDDFIVSDTPDVLLVCKKDKEQDIKEFVAEIKRNKGDKFL